MAYTSIDNPELFVQTKLYSGNAGTQSITLDGSENMQPDMVWIKCRSGTHSTENHNLYDSVRGATKFAIPNGTTAADSTDANSLTAFNTDGFSLGTRTDVNGSGEYCSWNWKAGTSFTNDASSTGIGSLDSSGSVSETAGFSICAFTGTGSVATIKHGLSTIPNVIITKSRANAENWGVLHSGINTDYQTDYLILNSNGGSGDSAEYYNDTAPTSSVFTVGTADATNDAANMIAYIFSERKGYSKFGIYTGTGVDSGTFSYCGFKPSFVLTKRTDSSGSWVIQDNKRPGYNETSLDLNPNNSEAEETNNGIDMLSNGFKQRNTDAHTNASGGTYIFMAFAESPFVNSNGIPNNAR